MYDLPKYNLKDLKNNFTKIISNKSLQILILLIIIFASLIFSVKIIVFDRFGVQISSVLKNIIKNDSSQKNNVFYEDLLKDILNQEKESEKIYTSQVSHEQAVIDSIKKVAPSVVSIIISKNVPIYEQKMVNPLGDNFSWPFEIQVPQYVENGTELQEVGAGSGFIISEDGLVLTNKHVVIDSKAEYTVITSDSEKYSAKVLALNPINDLAMIKIQSENKFPAIELGNSDNIQIGQTAIAIGNALGKFNNTVSVGVVSGLSRTISASDQSGNFLQTLEDVIQTDAAINMGNSGGPLINLKGEVIGINTAMAQDGQSIGFAIPINEAKRDIKQIIETNKISYPFLGVKYILINKEVKEKYNLPVDHGALLKSDNNEPAVTPDSAASKAGLKENDIVLELNGEKITDKNSLSRIIIKYNPGDKVTLKILRDNTELNIEVILGERT